MNIGIVGYGIVGKSVEIQFANKAELFINDIKYESSESIKEIVGKCPYIFICVPTPFKKDINKQDPQIITSVIYEINNLSRSAGLRPTCIIKSAITPNSMQHWDTAYRDIDIVVSPEYLTERTYEKDAIDIQCLIVGGKTAKQVAKLYEDFSNCTPGYQVGIVEDFRQAALIKYMENSFLAMTNIFHNQFHNYFHTIFKEADKDAYDKLMEVFYLDKRMGVFPFKYTVPGPDGDYGYGGKCLPKDVKSIVADSSAEGCPITLLAHVDFMNEMIRKDKDWERIDGAVL